MSSPFDYTLIPNPPPLLTEWIQSAISETSSIPLPPEPIPFVSSDLFGEGDSVHDLIRRINSKGLQVVVVDPDGRTGKYTTYTRRKDSALAPFPDDDRPKYAVQIYAENTRLKRS
jgi:hypothetical protein